MAGIFISYRQADAKAWAISLRDDLAQSFGDDQVFLDKDTLHAGNWREQIDQALDRCNVVLIVIGPRWLTIADEQNRPRLSLPDDVHRQEVALALNHHAATVIPVLVDDAAMPRADQLPEDMRRLCDQQAYKIGDTKATPGSLPPSSSSRAGSPSPATRPVRALRRGAPRARPDGVLARVGGARGAGRPQAQAPAGAGWQGVGGRRRVGLREK